MQKPLISVVTVTLNPGDDLPKTKASICEQDFDAFEWIVKDAGSKPGQLDPLKDVSLPQFRLVTQSDKSIFDAMNQGLALCTGKYVVFMNAGDTFGDKHTLSQVAAILREKNPAIAYGDYYNDKWKTVIQYPDHMTKKYLFRRVPCHQAVYTDVQALLSHGGFKDKQFKIAGDHESFMNVFIGQKGTAVHLPLVCARYKDDGMHAKGDGFKRRENERKAIKKLYFTPKERLVWGGVYALTLPRFRTWLTLKMPDNALRRAFFKTMATASKGLSKGKA